MTATTRIAVDATLSPAQSATLLKTGIALPGAAADDSLFNYCLLTGKEMLYVENTDVGAQTITIYSVDDILGRSEDITTESIAAGAVHIFGPFPQDGWMQADGFLYFDASDPLVKITVIRVP